MNNEQTTAQTIRQNLKAELGLNARKVSVREPRPGTVRVTVKDASIDIDAVRLVASREERIDRCQFSGEILSGGNTFVLVQHSTEILIAQG